jgi:tetratricopeptide (TPR) repeat protein
MSTSVGINFAGGGGGFGGIHLWRRLHAVGLAAVVLTLAACKQSNQGHEQSTSAPQTAQTRPQSESDTTTTTPSTEQNPIQAASSPTTIRPALVEIAGLIQSNSTGPARVRLHDYLQLHPNDSQALFLFGLSYHREQKYGQARVYFEQAAATPAPFPPVHYFYAWCMYYLGEVQRARESFEKYLQVNPAECDVYFGLGLIDLDENSLEAAERDFHKSIELAKQARKPDIRTESKAHARLAEVYERQDRLHEARSELERATTLYPDHYEAYYKLSRVLTRLGETEAAEKAKKDFFTAKERVRPGSTAGAGGAATQPASAPRSVHEE